MNAIRIAAAIGIFALLAGCSSLGRFAGLGKLVAPEYSAAIDQAKGLLAPTSFAENEIDGYWTYKGARIEVADLGWVYAAEKRGTMDKSPPPWWFSAGKPAKPNGAELDAVIDRLNSLKTPAAKEPK